MWKVYILKSEKKRWYYVGSTNDVSRRINEHNMGKVFATRNFVPLTNVYIKNFETEKEAREFERRIKKQRLLKEEIIRSIEK
jgi:predicted GIY-YIG superfamily endonuclease